MTTTSSAASVAERVPCSCGVVSLVGTLNAKVPSFGASSSAYPVMSTVCAGTAVSTWMVYWLLWPPVTVAALMIRTW